MTDTLQLIPLQDFPLVQPGDDLCQLLLDSLARNQLELRGGDLLVLAQKVVSKAENRYVKLVDVEPSAAARELAAQADKDPRQARDDFPDPETPVRTTSFFFGILRSMERRLCSRAPRMTM